MIETKEENRFKPICVSDEKIHKMEAYYSQKYIKFRIPKNDGIAQFWLDAKS